MAEVTVTMPLALTGDMLRAVRQHPTTSTEDKEEEHRRMGWLLCAWDVLTEMRVQSAPIADESLRLAAERTRDDLGFTGDNYPAVRKLLAFAEQAIAAGRA